MKQVNMLNCATIVQDDTGNYRYIYDGSNDHYSKPYQSEEEAVEAYYIQLAYDYHGNGIRDNSREAKIAIGKHLDEGGEP